MNTESPLRLKSSLVGLRSNSGPLKNVAVTFGPDVTALYGRNGAGKTWILNALRTSMRGYYHKGMTQLLCEFERGSAVFDWALQELSYHMRERRYSTLATLEEDKALLHRAIEEWFVRGGRYLRPYEDEDEIPAELVDELVDATAIAFVPIGSNAPEWDVWLCVPEDASRFPAFVRAVDEFRAETKQVDELERQMKLLDPELNAGESDELTEEEYIARQEEVERLLDEAVQRAWSYIYEPVMGWLWNYSYQPDPDHVRNWMAWMTSDDLPIPVVKLFTARNTPLVLEDEDDLSDLNIATAQAFSEHFQKELGVAEDGLVLSDAMRDWATDINAAANEIYAALLQDAPALTLEVLQPGRWVTEGALQWYVDHGSEYRQVKVPFSALSRAESRWARVAVRRALDVTGNASALIIDEPEAALHRVAERHMARGLDRLTAMGPQVVVATHSPEVLDTHSTRCVHVTKRAGQTSVGQLPGIEPAHLAELGLSPSDLLGLYRIFLLVEGEHDEVVIRALCGDVLESARVKVIPLRGGRKLPGTVESQILFDLSDAHLVAVLDDVDAGEVRSAWLEAQSRYLSADAAGAIDYLAQTFKGRKGNEYEWITNWLSRALKKAVHERMEPYGLAARDIVEYLPVEVLVPGCAGKSWGELRQEHDAAGARWDRSKGLHDFKSWLRHTYGADTSVGNIRKAAEAMDTVPEEFTRLGYRLREISVRPRSS